MRHLLNSHLFKLGDVESLFATHPFQHRDVSGLLCTHFFESSIRLFRPRQLRRQHRYVGLETLVDFALSLDLSLNCAQMLQLNEVRLEALLFVLLGDLSRCATSLFLAR